MSATTLCPTCHTRFRVSREQLDAHQGLVRCGRCQAVFNAAEFLQEEEAVRQADAPVAGPTVEPEVFEPVAQEPEAHEPEAPERVTHETAGFEPAAPEPASYEPVAPVEVPAAPEEFDFTAMAAAQPVAAEADAIAPQVQEPHVQEPHEQEPQVQVTHEPIVPLLDHVREKRARKKRALPWGLASLVMVLVLFGEAAYFFRVELAAVEPDLKPALVSYCGLLGCTVPLPRNADLMGIESSELEADPAASSVIALSALLRNHAPYAEAYPNLELTLTDAEEKPLARRSFRPAEYLKPGDDESRGLAANRELGVRLNLDTTDLKPSGYRLFLYYSQ